RGTFSRSSVASLMGDAGGFGKSLVNTPVVLAAVGVIAHAERLVLRLDGLGDPFAFGGNPSGDDALGDGDHRIADDVRVHVVGVVEHRVLQRLPLVVGECRTEFVPVTLVHVPGRLGADEL